MFGKREIPFLRFDEDSEEMRYMRERREELGGYLPERRTDIEPLPVPGLEIFDALLKSSGERELSTTMVFVRMLSKMSLEPKR